MSFRAAIARLRGWLTSAHRSQEGAAGSDFEQAVARASAIHAATPVARYIDTRRQNELARGLYLELHEIFAAGDRKTACRDKLVAEMLQFAPLRLLTIPQAPAKDASGLRSLPGISGELSAHIDAVVSGDPELRRRIASSSTPVDDDALWSSFWQSYWFLESFNAARIILGDVVADGDWYRAFMHAVCVSQEHRYRCLLGLPPMFAEVHAQAIVSAYSIYTDVVVSGADDPDGEWRDYCRGLNIPSLTVDGDSRLVELEDEAGA